MSQPPRRTRRRTTVRLTLDEFLALPPKAKRKRYENIMKQLQVDERHELPQVGDHYRSYQVTDNEVLYTEGNVTAVTGNKESPYEITCTQADRRGYVGKTVRAPARSIVGRTTKAK